MFDSFWDTKTFRVLFTTIVIVLLLAFVHGARETLTLFMVSILFAYLVNPMVSYLQRPLRGRIQAIAAVYVLFAILVGVLGFLIGPELVDDGRSLMASLPALVNRMASGQFIVTLGKNRGWENAQEIQSFFMDHRAQILSWAEGLAAVLEAPLFHIWWLILIPILGFFFLKDAPEMTGDVVDMASDRKNRSTLRKIVADVHAMLASYMRAQLILAALTAVALTAVLTLMRVPYSFFLSPLAGLCEFVPVVGPAVACTVIFVIAMFTGYPHLLWLFLVLGTWRVIQDYVNAPRIMGKSVEISPLVEIFVVLAGGEIGGVVGALVAVPALALLRIFWIHMNVSNPVPRVHASLPTVAEQGETE